MTIKETAAAFAAEHDVVVFPVGADKRPVLTGGNNRAGDPARLAWKRLTAAQAAALPYWDSPECAGFAVRLESVVVVDLDRPERRAEALAELGLTNCPTYEVATPRPGRHLYYRGERRSANFDGGEIKAGQGAYVVGPGSGHENGGMYEVVDAAASWASIPASYQHPGGGSGEPSANGSSSGGGGSGMVIKCPEQVAALKAALAALKGDVEHFDGITLAWRSGQWEGPCPRCRTGDDRFRLLTKGDKVLAHCRKCDASHSESLRKWLKRRHDDIALGYTLPDDDAVTVPCTRVRGYVPVPAVPAWEAWIESLDPRRLPDTPPMVLARDSDGETLLVAEQLIWLYGASFQGKSWIAAAVCSAVADAGGRALYLAYERHGSVARRWRAWCGDNTALARGPLTDQQTAWALEWLDAGPGVVVFDSAYLMGFDSSGDTQTQAIKAVKVWEHPQRSVVVVDHRGRERSTGRDKGPIGSQSKTAAADVQYTVTATKDAVGRITHTDIVDAGSNDPWHPHSIRMALAGGVPTLNVTQAGIADGDRMAAAVKAVRDGMKLRPAAVEFGVSRSTLQRRIAE